MSDSEAPPSVRQLRSSEFKVGGWLVEPRWNRIRRADKIVTLEPKVMRLLQALAAAAGEPATRQELLDTVWPGVLVNEEALSRAVSQLRRALGDDARSPVYVATVHKGGYCLVAQVTDAPEPQPESPPEPRRTAPNRLLFLLLLPAVLLPLLVYAALDSRSTPQAPRLLVPLTSDPGREIDPAVSPDGTRIAYLASTGTTYELFVRPIDGGPPLRLTRDAGAKGHPSWSPDGRRIAFVARNRERTGIFTVSADGGPVSKLIDLASWSFGLDWSPDGGAIAFSDAGPGEIPVLALVDIRSKATRPITDALRSNGDVKPAFSPDGKRLAFLRQDTRHGNQIALVDIDGPARPRVIEASFQQLRGLDWSPDGASVIFAARSERRFELWRVPAEDRGPPQRIEVEGGDLMNPSVSRNGRVVIENVQQDRDVWQLHPGPNRVAPLIQSTFDDYDPVFSPEGTQVAFVSERSGKPELWVQTAEGETRRLTSMGGAQLSRLGWSRDGHKIVFLAEQNGHASVYAQQLQGGRSRRLLGVNNGEVPLGWSADGGAVFLLAPTPGAWTLKQFVIATGETHRMPSPPLRLAALATDGRSIFGLAAGASKLLRIAPDGRALEQLRLPIGLSPIVALLPANRAVYIVQETPGAALLHRLDLVSEATISVAHVDFAVGGTLSVSGDGDTIAYTRSQETANDLAWTRL